MGVVALNTSTGSQAWRAPGEQLLGTGVRCSHSAPLVFAASPGLGVLTALNASTGAVVWRHEYGLSAVPLLPSVDLLGGPAGARFWWRAGGRAGSA